MGDLSIVTSNSKHFVADEVKMLSIDPVFIKEMGEPIIFTKNQVWLFAYYGAGSDKELVGFITFGGGVFLYAYTMPNHRNKGVFMELFKQVPSSIKKVVASNMALPIFLKLGFTIVKSYKICHKLIRN